MFTYVAKCKYTNKQDFYFFTQEMVIDNLNDVQGTLKKQVLEEWKKISPHEPPEIVDIFAGLLTLEKVK